VKQIGGSWGGCEWGTKKPGGFVQAQNEKKEKKNVNEKSTQGNVSLPSVVQGSTNCVGGGTNQKLYDGTAAAGETCQQKGPGNGRKRGLRGAVFFVTDLKQGGKKKKIGVRGGGCHTGR